MKAVGLVVVNGGVAYDYAPTHVDIRVVDVDGIKAGDAKVQLPIGVGFEHLVDQADVREYVDFICPQCGALAGTEPCKDEQDKPRQRLVVVKRLTYLEWVDTYKPVTNRVVKDAPYDGHMYTPTGLELAVVQDQYDRRPRCVWTLIETAGDHRTIVNGYRRVNSVGYFVTEEPYCTRVKVSFNYG